MGRICLVLVLSLGCAGGKASSSKPRAATCLVDHDQAACERECAAGKKWACAEVAAVLLKAEAPPSERGRSLAEEACAARVAEGCALLAPIDLAEPATRARGLEYAAKTCDAAYAGEKCTQFVLTLREPRDEGEPLLPEIDALPLFVQACEHRRPDPVGCFFASINAAAAGRRDFALRLATRGEEERARMISSKDSNDVARVIVTKSWGQHAYPALDWMKLCLKGIDGVFGTQDNCLRAEAHLTTYYPLAKLYPGDLPPVWLETAAEAGLVGTPLDTRLLPRGDSWFCFSMGGRSISTFVVECRRTKAECSGRREEYARAAGAREFVRDRFEVLPCSEGDKIAYCFIVAGKDQEPAYHCNSSGSRTFLSKAGVRILAGPVLWGVRKP